MSASSPGRTVLLVDDERDILESLKDLLEGSLTQVTCRTAPSATEALNELAKGGIHLILSDFKMPGMNGLDFLEQARQRYPAVPRVLMTAFPDLEVAIEAINEARVEAFLTKPLDPDKVVNLVREALEAHRISGRVLR
jgi:DNA-binding NtrC family response regulator